MSKDASIATLKKQEVISILKRRSSDQGSLSHSGSLFSLPDDDIHSEDSTSQGGYSEVSDEPVLGRKVVRERHSIESDEDSDIEDYRVNEIICEDMEGAGKYNNIFQEGGSQMSNSSYDMSEIRQSLLNETEDVKLQCLTAGRENVLFHFVQFDSLEGIILAPPQCKVNNDTFKLIVNNFRKCCHDIHKLFGNTLRFKVHKTISYIVFIIW